MKERPRGNIATILIVAILCLGLVMTIAALATSHLSFSNHAANSVKARNAAESVIQTTLAQLMADPEYGSAASPVTDVLEHRSDDALGRLAFAADAAAAAGLPRSLNNASSDAAAQGHNRVIPPEAVQLIAVGECGGVRRTIETVVHLPRFPYVICTSGRFESAGPLMLGVLPETAEAEWVTAEDLLPGHLASNSSAGDAVRLTDAAVISGDVEAVGGILAPPPVVIRGSRLAGSEPVNIPELVISDYDPEGKPGNEIFTGSSGDTALAGYNRSPGSAVVNGDLRLEAGVLYVAGDLVVNGDVKGRGAIFTEGRLTVLGCAQLEPDQQIALVAQGDVRLQGGGRFRGVVYTQGDFLADGVALVGAFIGNSGSGGVLRIVDAGLVAADPRMSFAESWLCSQTTSDGLWWGGPDVWGPYGEPYPNFYPADFPTWRQTSSFVGLEDGLIVVEWQIEGFFPEADAENFPTIYPRREYYTPEGELVKVSFQGPGGIAAEPATMVSNSAPSVPGAEDWVGSFDQDGQLAGALTIARQNQPGFARPERVRVYQEIADFRLDISQFFSLEDRMQTILWVEH